MDTADNFISDNRMHYNEDILNMSGSWSLVFSAIHLDWRGLGR